MKTIDDRIHEIEGSARLNNYYITFYNKVRGEIGCSVYNKYSGVNLTPQDSSIAWKVGGALFGLVGQVLPPLVGAIANVPIILHGKRAQNAFENKTNILADFYSKFSDQGSFENCIKGFSLNLANLRETHLWEQEQNPKHHGRFCKAKTWLTQKFNMGQDLIGGHIEQPMDGNYSVKLAEQDADLLISYILQNYYSIKHVPLSQVGDIVKHPSFCSQLEPYHKSDALETDRLLDSSSESSDHFQNDYRELPEDMQLHDNASVVGADYDPFAQWHG